MLLWLKWKVILETSDPVSLSVEILKSSFLPDLCGASSATAGLLKEAAGRVLILPLSFSFKEKLLESWACLHQSGLTPLHAWLWMTGEKQCSLCQLSWPTTHVVLFTLRNSFTRRRHLADFSHYLSLETLRGIILLPVKAKLSTIKRIFFLGMFFFWGMFLFLPQVHHILDEDTGWNVARRNSALATWNVKMGKS